YNSSTESRYSEIDGLHSFTVFIDALDDELEWIRSECKKMIADIQVYGIGMEEKVRVLRDPLFFGRYSETPNYKAKVIQYASSLNATDIKKVAEKYFKEIHQYEFVFQENKENLVLP